MGRITKMWLEPENVLPTPGLLASTELADVIPGSLFTSILPNLLIPGVAQAIRESCALKIMVCNLMTQPGETDGFRASDHLLAMEEYLGQGIIDACILNSREVNTELLTGASAAGCYPVHNDTDLIAGRGVRPVLADVPDSDEFHIRHDSVRLAGVVAELAHEQAGNRDWEECVA